MSLGAMLESAREMTMQAAGSASRLIDVRPMKVDEIRNSLSAPSEREVKAGMESVFELIASGNDVRELFANVVKNINAQDLALRKMVYAYLELYSDYEPELALMTINGIQKSLSDQSPVVRALALRAMSSIRVASISAIVGMGIRELSGDLSPIVRVACCQAIGKCCELDPSMGPDLLETLQKLIEDKRDPVVMGWGLAILSHYFPHRLDVIHKVYRHACPRFVDFDEWCQAAVLPLFVRYCRHFMSENDKDLAPLFAGVEPLLASLNEAVVLETAAVYLYLGSPATFDDHNVAEYVTALTQTELVLQNVKVLVKTRPDAFRPYLGRINMIPTDTPAVQVLKLQIIAGLCNESTFPAVFAELKFYVDAVEDEQTLRVVMETIAACATKAPAAVAKVIRWLLSQVLEPSRPVLVAQALTALRYLMQQSSQEVEAKSRAATLYQLAKVLDPEAEIPEAAAATIIWLLGEYSHEQPALATEILRRYAGALPSQKPLVRLQIVQLAAKVYSRYLVDASKFDARVPQLYEHVMYLGRYDPSLDTRDRTRMFVALLSEADAGQELATLLLQSTKPPPSFVSKDAGSDFLLDSAALALGHPVNGYISLENWGNGDPSLRDVDEAESVVPEPVITSVSRKTVRRDVPLAQTTAKLKNVSLEEFLASEDSSEEESESEESESESESASESEAVSGSESESDDDAESKLLKI